MNYSYTKPMFPGINLGFKGELLKTQYKTKPANERIMIGENKIYVGDIIICDNIQYRDSNQTYASRCKVTVMRPDGSRDDFECSVCDISKGYWKQLPFYPEEQ